MVELHYQATQAEIHKLVVGPYENNVFILRCRETGDAVLIDAANEHEKLLELCTALGEVQVKGKSQRVQVWGVADEAIGTDLGVEPPTHPGAAARHAA